MQLAAAPDAHARRGRHIARAALRARLRRRPSRGLMPRGLRCPRRRRGWRSPLAAPRRLARAPARRRVASRPRRWRRRGSWVARGRVSPCQRERCKEKAQRTRAPRGARTAAPCALWRLAFDAAQRRRAPAAGRRRQLGSVPRRRGNGWRAKQRAAPATRRAPAAARRSAARAQPATQRRRREAGSKEQGSSWPSGPQANAPWATADRLCRPVAPRDAPSAPPTAAGQA